MEPRPAPRRLLYCTAALLLLLGAFVSGCGGGSDARAAAEHPPVVDYSDSYVSFSHPAAWKASAPKGPGELHFHPLVYLSTQPVGDPCVVNGSTTTCDWPVKTVEPGGVVALWQVPYTGPQTGPSVNPPGTQIQVGGSPAWRQDIAGGDCRRIGADRTIHVEMPAHSLELMVCVRGPGIAQAEKSVNALLASVKFASR